MGTGDLNTGGNLACDKAFFFNNRLVVKILCDGYAIGYLALALAGAKINILVYSNCLFRKLWSLAAITLSLHGFIHKSLKKHHMECILEMCLTEKV